MIVVLVLFANEKYSQEIFSASMPYRWQSCANWLSTASSVTLTHNLGSHKCMDINHFWGAKILICNYFYTKQSGKGMY